MTNENFKAGERVKLSVTPIYEIYYNNGFGIYSSLLENGAEMVMKGNFPLPLNLQQVYEIEGKIVLRGFNKQIEVSSYKAVAPKGAYKVVTYLQQLSGLNKRAEAIYDAFGDKSINILKKAPEQVANAIKGVSIKKAKEWQRQLLDKEAEEKDILYLLNLGLSAKQAAQLHENYGSKIRKQISKNPYILLSVKGVSNYGFLKCDELARKMGFDFAHTDRIKEGLVYCLKEAGGAGHTYLPKEILVEKMKEVLGVRLTFTQMRSFLKSNEDEITLYSRTFKIDREDLEERVKKIDSLQKESAKEKYRYPLFSVEDKHIQTALSELEQEGVIYIHSNRIALEKYEQSEMSIAKDLFRLSKATDWKVPFNTEVELTKYLKENRIELESKQKEAVLRFAGKDGSIQALIGSAGTGKTFVLKIILALLEKVFKANKRPFKVKILTPTGKAARIASKATGFEAETIHRGLEYNPNEGFQRNRSNPIDATILVVDESSMMDASLAASLFRAIKTGTKVILMGDLKQLPSVAAGNVLRDLVNSNVIDKVVLEVVKRQGALSGIIKNANHIIAGEMMETCEETKDSFIINEEDDQMIQAKTIASIKRLLTFPGYTLEDIQVLVPQKRGSIGVYELNALIQSHFNQNRSGEKIRNLHADKIQLFFMKGDKVIHIKNNYNVVWHDKTLLGYSAQQHTGITNGETGVIEDIDTVFVTENGVPKKKKRIIVKYEDGYVFYHEGDEIKEINHAYCMSIHKSQGSQWKAVILPVSSQHAFFLDRNLIYTGWTRSQLFGTVIGPKRTLSMSIKKDKSIERFTQLQDFLIQQNKQQVA